MADDDPIQPADPGQPSEPVEADPDDPWIGQILGNYVLVERLGHGGMGVLYLARHTSLDRLAAAKFLPADMASDTEYVERFLLEARLVAKLRHDNIVQVHDAGSAGENIYYFIMEYVEGRDLGSLLEELKIISVPAAVACIQQAASALGYAHSKHIIHRDIKPGNLMLTTAGIVKVGDLGLAKFTEVGTDVGLTQPMTILGTATYISPEQIRGAKDVDSRTDIYSLGATFFHLVTGRVPYESETPADLLAMHLNHPVPEPHHANPNLDADICRIIKKMMAKNLGDRFQTMEEVVTALSKYQSQKTHPPQPISELAMSVPKGLLHPTGTPSSARSRRVVSIPTQPKPPAWRQWMIGASLLAAGVVGYLTAMYVHPAAKPADATISAEPTTTAAATVESPAPATAAAPRPEPVTPPVVVPDEHLVIADFEESHFLNNLGGSFREFVSQKPLGKSKLSVVDVTGSDGQPTRALQIDYDVSHQGASAGTKMDVKDLDATDYQTLSFKVKGGTGKTTMRVGIEGIVPQSFRRYVFVRDIGSEWKTVNLPLKDFTLPSTTPLKVMGFLVTGLGYNIPPDSILIDDIRLVK